MNRAEWDWNVELVRQAVEREITPAAVERILDVEASGSWCDETAGWEHDDRL